MKLQRSAFLIIGLMAFQVMAEDQKSAPTQPVAPAAQGSPTAPDLDKVNYAIGMNFGNVLKRNAPDADVDAIAKAMKDVLSGATPRFTDKEAQQILMVYQQASRGKILEKNKAIAETFLAKNAKEANVKTLPSGLQYTVITEGTGPTPKGTDMVTVNYAGSLINGTEFDSSYKRNKPFETSLNGVIKGWTEALQLMKVGSKWKLFIPPALAYGENGMPPKIEPNSALIFEVELLSIKAPEALAADSAQAVSGEIIKVPSAEEIKKGAKIEVIKDGQTNTVNAKPEHK